MSKLTKKQKSVADKIEAGKAYTLKEAAELDLKNERVQQLHLNIH